LFTAFFFGLLMDVHDAGLLGEHALSYTLVAYGAVVLHRRLQRFDLWSQAMHMLPVFFIARFVTQIIHAWLAGKWPGWDWGISVLLTTALWPLAGWVLHLPQRGVDDAESSSA
jgi:rod shape-determining protein MreD